MNRRIDWQNLEGFIYDNSCNLHRYSLNHDPKKFEKFCFLVDGCHFQGQKSKRKEMKGLEVTAILGALIAITSWNTRKTPVSTKTGQKTAKEGSKCMLYWSHWQNPSGRWTITISSVHLLYSSVLETSLSWTKFDWSNVFKLHILRNVTSIKYLRGIIGWGISGIDNLHYLHIMLASCIITMVFYEGTKYFWKFLT